MQRRKITISIDPELDEILKKRIMADGYKKSKSYYIEEAIRNYIDDNKSELPKQIEQCISNSIKTFEDRYCRILAKNTKTNFAIEYLLLNMLAYMCNSEEDTNFLMELRKESEKQGYMALKNNAIERDIDVLFPKEELEKFANKEKRKI